MQLLQSRDVNKEIMSAGNQGIGGQAIVFFPLGNINHADVNESHTTIIFTDTIYITRMRTLVTVHTGVGETLQGTREDGVSTTLITIPQGNTGLFDTGPINITLEAGAAVCGFTDTRDAGSTSITIPITSYEYY